MTTGDDDRPSALGPPSRTQGAGAVRLPPLPEEQWDDRTREAVSHMLPRRLRNARGAGNGLSTLLRHPDLTQAFLAFNNHLLLRSTLPPRVRELAILRVAKRRECAYEWAQHVRLAAGLGLSEVQIEAAGRGEAADPFDREVLRAVDELDGGTGLSDGTWERLSKELDEKQLMDLIFTVGGYAMLAVAFNTFGTAPEEPDARPGDDATRASAAGVGRGSKPGHER
ncbi:4-carboxymuconolactone decarboxylase [Frankia sp. AiPs1]|uniref:carboxymuconolactone decarboxylase family protein n=1 Tax=Frankia sp. AiPa1 TaxID=573492 RepID=UPI00202B9511|nr:carboxymuconolactone decarboxylase family protein [Frankia sp. AiPa1]MCL9760080.1 carboxymuconolactone decarboxylase family protein [Frankia sp. AiPa1]